MPNIEPANRNGLATVWLLLKLAVFTLLVPGTLTVWLPLYWLYPAFRQQPIGWGAGAAGAIGLIALGIAGYLVCSLDFVIFGRGTPAPIDPPKVLVARGLYKFTRNPIYISVVTILLGESALFRSVSLLEFAGIVAIFFHVWVLIVEEPDLRGKMGEAYRKYCDATPRWILRLPARHSHHAV